MRPEDASRIVHALWGQAGVTCSPLVGEQDHNFRVVTRSGDASVLKVMHPGATADDVALQVEAMDAVAAASPELPVPRVIPTTAPAPWGEWEDAEGRSRLVWRITWMEGRTLAETRPRTPALLRDLGGILARTDQALAAVAHPAAERVHPWDLARAGAVLGRSASISEPGRRALVERAARDFRERVATVMEQLPAAVIHGDANDHNVLVRVPAVGEGGAPVVTGLLDFGDMVASRRVFEPAIAGAYALLGTDDPVASLAAVAAGYHAILPLTDLEIALLLPLVRARLGMSVVFSAERALTRPGEAYLTVSEGPAWAALAALNAVPNGVAEARIRAACGVDPSPRATRLASWLADHREGFQPILPGADPAAFHVLDLSVGSLLLGADPAATASGPLGERVRGALADARASVGVGRWNEPRPIYTAPEFRLGDHPTAGARTVHLGLDLWVPAGTPLHAPLPGVVESLGELAGRGNYGPTLLLRHDPEGAPAFWTLWGHLDPDVLERWAPGDPVQAGAVVARVGAPPGNGDWPPHLHLQVVLELPGGAPDAPLHDIPGVVDPGARAGWKAVFPNPAALAGLDPASVDAEAEEAAAGRDRDALRTRRARLLGRNLSLSYREPLHLVKGWRQFLYDDAGRGYLDLYNNVPHVGHSHPRVVEAVRAQAALLNTNTRYLHDTILRYAEALTARMPSDLEVAYFVNSASEANELALRLVRAATGRRELMVMEAGYHGHTTTLVQVSPYKFAGPGGEGREPWVEVADLPDLYRGRHRREDPGAPARYVADVEAQVARMAAEGRPLGAFLAESLPSVGGQVVLPDGYLAGVYRAVRAAGGLCVADEVQVGFGRLGEVFWGFELQGVVPDVVVLGKPMGNGFPLGAVVCRREIAEAFDTGMEFFSTFGGNPVSCAAGLAVLEVLEEEALQAHALAVGRRLTGVLQEVAAAHPALGEVRGMGLFQGVEVVSDPEARTPWAAGASYLVNRLAERGILTGTDGPDHNVVKLRGPMVVEAADVDRLGAVLAEVVEETPFRF
ncbi:MAG TPA: aminotransferase class III-fold pyridoxal phosphate-dependent enzyme [Longimicrobiales bacterium]|nr:aminotransferase class III-fold pyridoxal phosphate-dependent enzyme [Longimicrobiales bacterium]